MSAVHSHIIRSSMFALLVLTPFVSKAGQPAKGLSLNDAIRSAVIHNWDLLASKANIDQSKAQEMIAHEFPNPNFNLSTSKISLDRSSRTELGNSPWDRSYDSIAAFSQFFELGGKRQWRQLAARHGLLSAEAQFQDAERLLKNAVIKAYAKALQEDESVRILKETEAAFTHEADIAKKRLDSGDIAEADKQQIDIAAQRFAADREVEEANAVAARINLEVLLGEDKPTGSIMLSDSLTELSDHLAKDIPSAKGERPDLVAARALVEQLAASVKLAEAMKIPDITAQLQYEHEPADKPNTIGIGISIPLPVFNKYKGEVAAAKAQQAAAQELVGKIRAHIFGDAAQAYAAYKGAHDKWEHYTREIAPKSHDSLESIRFAYQKGGVPLVTLLAAQRNDNDIHIAAAQAAADTVAAAADMQSTQPYVKK
jgi:cobalt-zinc-cadmium efflux system outer membrane protein